MSARTKKQLTCPECGAAVHRAHRRPIERIASFVVPLRRYSCHHCGWSGVRVAIHAPWSRISRQQLVVRVALIVLGLLIVVVIVISISR